MVASTGLISYVELKYYLLSIYEVTIIAPLHIDYLQYSHIGFHTTTFQMLFFYPNYTSEDNRYLLNVHYSTFWE